MQRRTFLAASSAFAAASSLPAVGLAQNAAGNPITAPWTAPFGGGPAFDAPGHLVKVVQTLLDVTQDTYAEVVRFI